MGFAVTWAPSRTLWLDPGFGASGDMMLGALFGLGAPIDEIRAGLQALAVDGWSLDHEDAQRCALRCTRALVSSSEDHHHRTWSSIDSMLAESSLPDEAKRGARATFRRLGEVEAGIHDVSIDDVHFHEVGAIDAIVDIVGSWLALSTLGIDRVVCGPVGLGHGSTTAAHGRLPIPAPATTELLIGADIEPVDVSAETITPTGAALLVTMASTWGPIPAGRLVASSRGAGGRDPEQYPNALSAYLIETAERGVQTGSGDEPVLETAVTVTTNLDDVTPEIIGHTIGRCLAVGAADAWARPIVMKKARPGFELNVLCSPDLLDTITELIFAETATLGLRTSPVTKFVLPRRFEDVIVRGETITIKVGPHGAKPEYEDLVQAASALGCTVRELASDAMAAFRARSEHAISTGELAKSEIAGQTLT